MNKITWGTTSTAALNLGAALVLSLALSACGGSSTKTIALPDGGQEGSAAKGEGFLIQDEDNGTALVSTDGRSAGAGGTGIAVNSFLWRASLDTLSFMPLVTADPFGGVIVTDWYTSPEVPNERFKVQVYILDRRLRADAVNLSIFRQERDQMAQWVDKALDPDTKISMENAILNQARLLRNQSRDR